jgi:hypothetical protein
MYPASNTPEGKLFSSWQGANAIVAVSSILDSSLRSHPVGARSFVNSGKEIIQFFTILQPIPRHMLLGPQ